MPAAYAADLGKGSPWIVVLKNASHLRFGK
jgi:hypothetical protein